MRESHLYYLQCMKLVLAVVTLYICQIVDSSPSSNDLESKILSHYKPLAVDVSLVKDPEIRADSSGPSIQDGFPNKQATFDELDPFGPLNDRFEPPPPQINRGLSIDGLNSGLADIKDSGKLNISETIFALDHVSPELGKLITGKDKPTFAIENVAKPKVGVKTDGKIIASYKLLIPILIPAIVKKLPTTTTKPVQFSREVHTKMVPMKKIVPRVKTVLKAERVPQKIITDYVKIDSHAIPSKVDDKLKPEDEVIGSVIENYD